MVAIAFATASCSSQSNSSLPSQPAGPSGGESVASSSTLPSIVANPATVRGKKPNTQGADCDDSNSPDVCVNQDSGDDGDDGDGDGGGGGDGGCAAIRGSIGGTKMIARVHRSIVGCDGGGGSPSPAPTPINYANKISAAATAFKGKSTRGLNGAPKGNECVAAVNQVLINAGLSPIGPGPGGTNSVSVMQTDLPNSGYTSVSQSSAVAGDIVVLQDADGGTHVGIYEGNGEMISNSSSSGTFSYDDTVANEGTNAAETDDGLPASTPLFYHHN